MNSANYSFFFFVVVVVSLVLDCCLIADNGLIFSEKTPKLERR